MTKTLIFAAVLALASLQAAAQAYSSPKNRFALSYSTPWATTAMVDQEVEIFLLCEKSVCGPTVLLSAGAFFDPNLRTGALSDFLKHATGEIVTQRLRTTPMIQKVTILKEGRTKLGRVDAYEVVAEVTIQGGRKRIRHTFMTFNAGYVYTLALGSLPEAHQKSLETVKPVLATFRFTQ